MFSGAVIKLRDARTAMERLTGLVLPPVTSNIQIISGPPGPKGNPVGTDSPVKFAEAFSSCVAQVRSIGDAVLKNSEAKKQAGFPPWKELKKSECQNDELLRFINDRRNSDLHNGCSPLTFSMHPFAFNSGAVGAVPSSTASLFIDGTGPHWLVDQGTARERQVACEASQGVAFTVAVANPPIRHLGSILQSTDPIALLRVAEQYYANLVFEARSRFA